MVLFIRRNDKMIVRRTTTFNTEEERFEFEHPHLHRLVEDDPNFIVLSWADEKRYITLKTFRENTYYTDQDLETALMWQN